MDNKKLILIDGHSILNRAFYGVPDLTNAEGIHTNALYGFLNILFKFLDEEKPDYITVAFDLSAPTFRHKAFDAYKGTRKPMQPELKQQVPLMKELLEAMNIKIVELEGYEADDILGTIAKSSASRGINVSIISGDRDLLQLSDELIKIRIPKTKKGVTEVEDYYPKDVYELYGVTPQEFIDVKALMGDSSDNIPGAPGIGPKTASAIISQYHSVDNVIAHIDEIKPPKAKASISDNVEQIRMSRFLSEIKTDVPLEYNIDDAATGDYFNPKSYELFKKYGFKNMLKKFEQTDIVTKDPECYQHFHKVTDFGEAETIFNKASAMISEDKGKVGLSVIRQKELIAVGLALSETDIYYIPVSGFITDSYLVSRLSEVINKSSNRNVASANIKGYLDLFVDNNSDYPQFDQKSFIDTAIAAYLIHPSNDKYDYEALGREFLSLTFPSRSELLGKNDFSQALEKCEDNLVKYACLEAYTYYSTADKIMDVLKNENMSELFETIEMPLIFVLFDMQQQGIRVDEQALNTYSKILGDKIKVLEKQIYEEAGEEFNINSPKQLGVILFEKLGMPNGKKTKSGYSTAADVLEKLAPDYPVVSHILEYRQLAKLKSTYADGLTQYIAEDGRIHGTFNQTITATGRISSTEPNLQNIPIRMEMGRAIRKVFVPRDGYVFIDADYSQIELRILAHMSGDEKLIQAYNSSEDIHRATASEVFGVPLSDVTPEQRRNAKAVNFGIIYGMSSFGLSQDLSISRKEAKEYIDKYFATYPTIKTFIDGLVKDAKEKGYSLTMYGRRREIPEIKSQNFMQRSFGERVAMNAPIQGTAADIIKIAMINVYNELKNRNLKSRLILQVHDELLVEAAADEVDVVKQIMLDGMKNAASLKVMLEVDMKSGSDWLEAH